MRGSVVLIGRAGRRAMRFEMGGVDHQPVRQRTIRLNPAHLRL